MADRKSNLPYFGYWITKEGKISDAPLELGGISRTSNPVSCAHAPTEKIPGYIRPRIYFPAFNSEYTIVTNRSALVPAPAGNRPPGTFAS